MPAWLAPRHPAGAVDFELQLERYALANEKVSATIRFLTTGPVLTDELTKPPPESLILLTNGRGGMARLRTDLGRIESKYDCALGANLNSELPG